MMIVHRARAVIGVPAALALLLGAVIVPSAHATTAPTRSSMWLRNTSTTIYRQDGLDGATVGVSQVNNGVASAPEMSFYAQPAGSSQAMHVQLSRGLKPGTYVTGSFPGRDATLLSADTVNNCGYDGAGSLTVLDATYAADGLPTVFDATFTISACDEGQGDLHGQLRWRSTRPLSFAGLSAPAVPQGPDADPVTVNDTRDTTVTVTGGGDAPTVLGRVRLYQKPLPDGTTDWSVGTDGCSGRTLPAGATCTVVLHYAPLRPNGSPAGVETATLTVPDGSPVPAAVVVGDSVVPLAQQPVGLTVHPAFRHLLLTWGRPQDLGGWSRYQPIDYDLYRIEADGTRTLMTTTQDTSTVIAGLPDGYTARYVLTASQGKTGPDSVPATGSTASAELVQVMQGSGLRNVALAPVPVDVDESSPYRFGVVGSSDGPGVAGLDVARDQSVLAWSTTQTRQSPESSSVTTARVDNTTGSDFTTGTADGFDTDPAVSPDGTEVAFSHAVDESSTPDVEIASTATGATAAAVPGSSGLTHPTWSANGALLVAVRTAADGSTDLVRLARDGTVSPIAGTGGLDRPDVAADGRIVAERPAASGVAELVIVPADGSTTAAIAGLPAGTNSDPHFSADGSTVQFVHAVSASGSSAVGVGDSVDLDSGEVTVLDGSGEVVGTPFVLRAPSCPATPHHATATPGPTSVTVTWSGGGSADGSPVTGYRVQRSVGGIVWTDVPHAGVTTSQTVSWLDPTSSYLFRVAALNSTGQGVYSRSTAAVMPLRDPTALTVAAAPAVRYGSTVTVGTRLTDTSSGAPLVGAPVTLVDRAVGATTWTVVRTVTTGAGGAASSTVTPTRATEFRWQFQQDAVHGASTSPTARSTVAAWFTSLGVTARSVRHGKPVEVYGTVAPGSGTVHLQQNIGGVWRETGHTAAVRRQRLPDGRTVVGFVIPVTFAKAQSALLRCTVPASSAVTSAASASFGLKIT